MKNISNNFYIIMFAAFLAAVFLPYAGLANEIPAGKTLEIIKLDNRSAEEIIPVIKPLLDHDDRISGTRYQLILRASPATITQIKNLLTEIDTPLRKLNISVKYARETRDLSQDLSLSANVSVNRNKQDKTLQPKTHLNTKITRTQSDEQNMFIQQVQVIEGNWASFSIGQLTPETASTVNISGLTTSIQSTTRYRQTASGFRVKPAIRKDHVVMKIEPHVSKPAGLDKRHIDRLDASTEISGKLGTWIELGSISTSQNEDPSGKTYSTRKSFSDNRQIWVKVDEINDNQGQSDSK